MRELIVNADDLGSGPGRDRGIFRAYTRGIVTSASLLPTGPTFAAAAREARACALPVGVHLNLSEGAALTGEVPGLTDGAGVFPGKIALRRILASQRVDLAAIRRELAAQIERVLDAGILPDHIDTHQHFFLFPAVTGMILQLCRDTGIGAVRLPIPAEDAGQDPPPPLGEELALYRRLAPAAAAAAEEEGIFTPKGLYGMPLLNRLDLPLLASTLRQIPCGRWELMVHPGHPDPGSPFSGREREIELETLTAPEIRSVVEEMNIHLTTFGDCVCASS